MFATLAAIAGLHARINSVLSVLIFVILDVTCPEYITFFQLSMVLYTPEQLRSWCQVCFSFVISSSPICCVYTAFLWCWTLSPSNVQFNAEQRKTCDICWYRAGTYQFYNMQWKTLKTMLTSRGGSTHNWWKELFYPGDLKTRETTGTSCQINIKVLSWFQR